MTKLNRMTTLTQIWTFDTEVLEITKDLHEAEKIQILQDMNVTNFDLGHDCVTDCKDVMLHTVMYRKWTLCQEFATYDVLETRIPEMNWRTAHSTCGPPSSVLRRYRASQQRWCSGCQTPALAPGLILPAFYGNIHTILNIIGRVEPDSFLSQFMSICILSIKCANRYDSNDLWQLLIFIKSRTTKTKQPTVHEPETDAVWKHCMQ